MTLTTTLSGSTSTKIFEGAHDMIINNLTINDNSRTEINTKGTHETPGLDRLLDNSMRDAFHDSSARSYPPRCHYGTRQEFIKTITEWGNGTSERTQRVLWMCGPFGVGKSAIAQSCSEILASQNKLGASLFFSRPNHFDNPNHVFTSIAYQLSYQCASFGRVLDLRIREKPTLLTASRAIQFEELLVNPLRQVAPEDARLEGLVIIVDGLDECEGIDAQQNIIELITSSIRNQTTPFRWLITSRPEPHIQRSMGTDVVSSLLYHLDVPLSPKDDNDILKVFTEELEKIGKQHGLPVSWVSEADIAILVDLAAGLWVYVNTVVRFIGAANSLGPVSQLQQILSIVEKTRAKSVSAKALARMDVFYDLIMEQIPSDIVSTVQRILLLNQVYTTFYGARVNRAIELANVLGLSKEQFRAACSFLQSVLLYLENSRMEAIMFYHASFMEYMGDPQRSKGFCIYGDCLESLQLYVIDRINHVHSSGIVSGLAINALRSPSSPDDEYLAYWSLVFSLIRLCDRDQCILRSSVAVALLKVQFSKIPVILKALPFERILLHYDRFRGNLPPEFRNKIFRRTQNPLYKLIRKPEWAGTDQPFILGHGKNRLICWQETDYEDYVRVITHGSRWSTIKDGEFISTSHDGGHDRFRVIRGMFGLD